MGRKRVQLKEDQGWDFLDFLKLWDVGRTVVKTWVEVRKWTPALEECWPPFCGKWSSPVLGSPR